MIKRLTCWKTEPAKDGRFIFYEDHLKAVEKYKASVRHAQKGVSRAKKKIERLMEVLDEWKL